MRAVLIMAVLALSNPAAAQDVSSILPTCVACHGAQGISAIPSVPSLGAMPVNYVLTQLYLFRGNIRMADPMNAVSAKLTDDDLRGLGKAFNAMPAPPPKAVLSEADMTQGAALVEQYHCNSCHGAELGGQQTIPRIAGQHASYIQKALTEYKSNVRKGYSATMNETSQEIKDEDMPLLARYVANFRGTEPAK